MTTPLGGRLDQPSLAETDEVRRILFIAYFFPPLGGGGVQRSVKFVRYLPEFGYGSIVITGPGGASDRWTPEDASLADELPAGTEIHRVSGPEPQVSQGSRRLAERLLDMQPPFARWWVKGATALGEHVGGDVDLIFGECVPYETAEVAARLARKLGKPWVADLQDPWALDEIWLYPSIFHRYRDLGRMRRLLGTAEAIVMNTPEAAERLRRRFPELARRLIVSIPNGFDSSDFEEPPPERSNDTFRIVHTGFLYTDVGLRHRRTSWIRRLLGGMPVPGVDLLTRSHFFLIEAVEQLVKVRPDLRPTIEIHLAGVLSPADRQVGERSPAVRMHGYLSHGETIALMRSANLLFLPMQDLPSGTRAGLVPGKTYEYLASGRPILAAVPDGDARDLLLRSGIARLCRPADSFAMSKIIEEEYERWREGTPTPPPSQGFLAQYERRRQTSELARTLDCALKQSSRIFTPLRRS
jgi:glycosyltransferase involved in cell wall biosynthesis